MKFNFITTSNVFLLSEATLSTINGTSAYPEKRSYNHSSNHFSNCSTAECNVKSNSLPSNVSLSNYFYHTECTNSEAEIFAKAIYVVACGLSVAFVYFSNKRFGRRQLNIASCLFVVASSLATSFADAVPIYLILRFFTSLTVINIYLNCALTLTGYVHKDFKLLYFITGHLGWGLAHFLLTLVSWLANDWRSFNLALSIICMIMSVLVWWSPESPESYPKGGSQLPHSRKALKYAAFVNGYSTTDVDQLPQGCRLRQDVKHDLLTTVTTKEKILRTIYFGILFVTSFTTTFLYFSVKWNTEWFKVRSGRLSFSFLGTTEVSAAIVILFLSTIVAVKYLWAVVSSMTSVLMVITYFRNKPDVATSSAKLFTITVFFAAAAWALLLVKTFCHKVSCSTAKLMSLITIVAVFFGALSSSTAVLKATNQDLLLVFAVPHLIAAIAAAFLPDAYFGVVA